MRTYQFSGPFLTLAVGVSAPYQHAAALGCEGIVSKRKGSRYVSGCTDTWVKVKNPATPAFKREAEEDWSR
jgi:ATP-dependent DNA ligase